MKPTRRPNTSGLSRWRAAAAFAMAGLATTVAISAIAIAINVARPVENPDAVMLRDLRTNGGRAHHYTVPPASQGHLSPSIEVIQHGFAGMIWFTVSQFDDKAADEIGKELNGPTRRRLRDCAPLAPWIHAGVRINAPPEYSMCGRPGPIHREWRWYGVGWPLIAFECEVARERVVTYASLQPSRAPEIKSEWTKASGGLLAAKNCDRSYKARVAGLDLVTPIPLTPIPLGLAGNTAFWASAWFVLIRGRRTAVDIRAWSRRRRERCEACGYALSGLAQPRCPECGFDRVAASNRVHA